MALSRFAIAEPAELIIFDLLKCDGLT
jgi:hypothetical protein